MLRGTAAGLEFVFAGRPFDEACADMERRLSERPDFYRGSQATAVFNGEPPEDGALARFVETVNGYGIVLRGIYGGDALAPIAERHALAYLGEPPRPTVADIGRKRAARAFRTVELTEKARSLEADFAGARADIAGRRARGEASVPKPAFGPPAPARAPKPPPVPADPAGAPAGTLYHRGTLRGGQSLQQLGSLVVVGDVNPGAEIVATGDIVVFGALRGTAHAGAQGDDQARVFALELAPTQLRIATLIAADDGGGRRSRGPEVAFIEGGRIALAPFAKVGI